MAATFVTGISNGVERFVGWQMNLLEEEERRGPIGLGTMIPLGVLVRVCLYNCVVDVLCGVARTQSFSLWVSMSLCVFVRTCLCRCFSVGVSVCTWVCIALAICFVCEATLTRCCGYCTGIAKPVEQKVLKKAQKEMAKAEVQVRRPLLCNTNGGGDAAPSACQQHPWRLSLVWTMVCTCSIDHMWMMPSYAG